MISIVLECCLILHVFENDFANIFLANRWRNVSASDFDPTHPVRVIFNDQKEHGIRDYILTQYNENNEGKSRVLQGWSKLGPGWVQGSPGWVQGGSRVSPG